MDMEEKTEGEDLYSLLEVSNTASESEIRKAYYRLALKCHPDRNPDDSSAKEKFQKLGRAYEILGDKEKRAIYDETGIIDGEEFFSKKSSAEWDEHWRKLFKKISVDDITAFENTYKNSNEEEKDLKEVYKKFKGNMEDIFANMILASENDVERFTKILQTSIKSGELPSYPAFSKSSKTLKKTKNQRKKEMEKEAKEAEELATKMGLRSGDEDSLRMAIISKNQKKGKSKQELDMEALVSKIQSKYTSDKGKTKKGYEEPSEEEFMKARQRLEEKKVQDGPKIQNKSSTKRKRN